MSTFGEKIIKGFKYVFDKDFRFYYKATHGYYHDMPDEEYLKKMYKYTTGHELNLDDPQRFSEKLQWLKLYNRNPEYTKMVDKYEVKKYVADIIGEEYVLPALAVWDSVDEIDISGLPDQFVLKCTHDSGGFAICKDKKTFDLDKAKKKLSRSMKRNYYWSGREWPYKNVKPRILAEPFIDSLGKPDSVEYKITCADGKLCFGTICGGIAHVEFEKRSNDHYDENFQIMPWYAFYKPSKAPLTEKPKHYDEIIELAKKLSVGIPSVRVDFYVHEDHIYFGEMTFFTWGGFLVFVPDEWDLKLSKYITLPDKKIF